MTLIMRCLLLTALSLFVPCFAQFNITTLQPNDPFAPSPLPASHADSDGEQVVQLFQRLGRNTDWKLIDSILFQGDCYEPEGMVRLGANRWILSAGEYTAPTIPYGTTINGTDRSPGAGFAHLIVFDGRGNRIADAVLSKPGHIEYHNGGIDYDGTYIWATIAQYRPNSTAHVVRIDPRTLKPERILHSNDHQGGVVHDVDTNKIYTLNWGSRNTSTWSLLRSGLPRSVANAAGFTPPDRVVRNPSSYVDYQDCKFLGHSKSYANRPVMLCSGVATIGSGVASYQLGGIAIVDVESMVPLSEVPIGMRSVLGTPVTQNPVEVEVMEGKLRMYWMPDQHASTMYVYEAQ